MLAEPKMVPTICFSKMVSCIRLTVTSISAMGWMLVTTTRPRLAVSAMIDSIMSPAADAHGAHDLVAHVAPGLLRRSAPAASSTELATWVAPKEGASSRLRGTGSMAKILSAPASRAPWMAAAPMPPTPITAT